MRWSDRAPAGWKERGIEHEESCGDEWRGKNDEGSERLRLRKRAASWSDRNFKALLTSGGRTGVLSRRTPATEKNPPQASRGAG